MTRTVIPLRVLRAGPLLMLCALAGAEPAIGDSRPPATAPQVSIAPSTTASVPLSAYSALGSSLAQSGHFAELGWSEAQLSAFVDGFRAAFRGTPVPMNDAAQQLVIDTGRRIADIAAHPAQPAAPVDPKVQLAKYFKEMRRRLGLQISDSGLGYHIQPGRNAIRPRPGDTIIFTCEVTAADGTTKLPQLSADRIREKMDDLLPGLLEGLQMMTVDGTAIFVLPPALSFADGPWPDGVVRGSPLVFRITLNDVISSGAQPPR